MFTKSSATPIRYKQMLRKLHDVKHDVRNTKIRRIIQCLLVAFIIIIICLFSKHIISNRLVSILPSTQQHIININITNPNSTINSKNTTILDVLGINPKNLSQINIIEFIKHWGERHIMPAPSTTHNTIENNTSLINIWSKNISHRSPLKIPRSALNDITIANIVWDFGACGCTGWGIEIVNIIKPLHERVSNIKLITDHDCWCPGFTEKTVDLMNTLQSNDDYIQWDPIQIFVSHKPPSRYPQFPYYGLITIEQRPEIVIGRSMTEVDYIPREEIDRMKSNEWVDELWVPSRFVKIIYVQHGVHPNKIRVIGEPINIDIYNDKVKRYKTLPSRNKKKGLIKITKKTFRFLSVGKWEPRKGFDILLRAFITEFTKTDNVQLYIQTYAYEQNEDLSRDFNGLQRRLNETIADIIDSDTLNEAYIMEYMYPKIEIMSKKRSMTQLASLYKTADCLVLPSHGEGFGLPVLEAMAVATPVIVTKWSGLRDVVISDLYGYLVDIEGKEYARNTPGRHDFMEDKQKWAKINVTSLMTHMRSVYKDQEKAKRIGLKGQEYVMAHFHPDIIVDKIEKRIKELIYLKRHNLTYNI